MLYKYFIKHSLDINLYFWYFRFISAISEGRGMARGEIGIAAIDLRHPHLVLCQFSDTLLYTHTLAKINYFNPIEVLKYRYLLNILAYIIPT